MLFKLVAYEENKQLYAISEKPASRLCNTICQR